MLGGAAEAVGKDIPTMVGVPISATGGDLWPVPWASGIPVPREVITVMRTARGAVPGVGEAVVFTDAVYILIAKVMHEFLGMSLSHSVGGEVTTVAPVVRNDGG